MNGLLCVFEFKSFLDHVTALVCKFSSIEDSTELRSKLESLEIPFEDILIANVPIRRPITKKQYEAWNAIWPLVFHESMDEKYNVIVCIIILN